VDSNNQNVADLNLNRDCFALKMKALKSFETSKATRLMNGIICQQTNLQQHHCENLRSHNRIILMVNSGTVAFQETPALFTIGIFNSLNPNIKL